MKEAQPETQYLGQSIIVLTYATLLFALLLPSQVTNAGAHWLPLILMSNAVLGAAFVAKHHLAHAVANTLMRLSCGGTIIAIVYASFCGFAPTFYAAYRLHALLLILPLAIMLAFFVPRLSKSFGAATSST